jgi:N-methylhydantoinase A
LDEQNTLGLRRLNRDRAERTIFNNIAKPLGLSLDAAAMGILHVADAQMERAIRLITVERGYDPRELALLAFGGAGPMHGATLAKSLGIPRVITPPVAGVLSALGLLVADTAHDLVRTFIQSAQLIDYEKTQALFEELIREAQSRLGEEIFTGVDYRRAMDLRYRGQSHELTIELEANTISINIESIQKLVARFHQTHKQRFGYSMPDQPVEIVNARLRASGERPKPRLRFYSHSEKDKMRVSKTRKVFFRELGWVESEIWARADLATGKRLQGPAIIEGEESTVVMLPDQSAYVDSFQNIIIELESEGAR